LLTKIRSFIQYFVLEFQTIAKFLWQEPAAKNEKNIVFIKQKSGHDVPEIRAFLLIIGQVSRAKQF